MVATSCLVTDRLRYVMIVSIPDTITHQELERKLFLKKTYGEVLNLKLKAIIARERLRQRFRATGNRSAWYSSSSLPARPDSVVENRNEAFARKSWILYF